MMQRRGLAPAVFITWLLGTGALLAAADYSTRDLTEALFRAEAGQPIDLSGKSLRELDLSGVDFKRARMAHADLYGADLTDANLSGTDLQQALLDRARLTRADFTSANLEGATILRPTVFSALERNQAEAPRFIGAAMAKTSLSGWLDGSDFSRADLSGAVFGLQDAHNEGLLASRVRLAGCKFSGATLGGADFRGSSLVFARFDGADARGADFRGADLTNADFSAARVDGMDVTGAILDGANFSGAAGFERIKGLVQAQGADRILGP